MSDYLAIMTANGLCSWARNPNKDEAVKSVTKRFRADWRTILKPAVKKPTITVLVYDVEGHTEVWWDDFGIYGDKSGESEPLGVTPEKIPHTYDKW